MFCISFSLMKTAENLINKINGEKRKGIINSFAEKPKEIKNSKHLFEPMTEKPKDFEPDIFIAAKEGKLSSIQNLIEKEGIDINKQVEKNYNDLIIYKGDTALHVACEKGHLPVVQYLIEKGANIEAKDKDQRTTLYITCL